MSDARGGHPARVLVTGGAGYIGSHVVLALGEAGHEVLTYDNLSTGRRQAVLHGALVVGDLADQARLLDTLRAFRPDTIMHFAASIEVGESVRDPLKYYRNNSANALNLLEAARSAGVGRFIFSSTAAVYGNPPGVPVDEAAPLAPINPYGASKLVTERMLADLAGADPDFCYVSLRYFNVAGADPLTRLGQDYANPTHLITRTLKTALGIYPQLQVFGSDYPTPDGTCIRDYIHVMDLCQAHLLALDKLATGGDSDAFNLGNGNGFSVQQVIDAARRITGKSMEVKESPRRPGDPARLVANSERAKNVLGWQPQCGDLDVIVAHAWAWEKNLCLRHQG